MLLVSVSSVALLFALFAWGNRCDESCGPSYGARWIDDAGAWQWTGQLLLAVAAWVAAAAAVWRAGRSAEAARLAIVSAVLLAIWYFGFMAPR